MIVTNEVDCDLVKAVNIITTNFQSSNINVTQLVTTNSVLASQSVTCNFLSANAMEVPTIVSSNLQCYLVLVGLGGLTVQGSASLQDVSSTSATIQSLNVQTLTASSTVNIPSTVFQLDGKQFYMQGNWTPIFTYRRAAGNIDPPINSGATVTYLEQEGHYTKIGNQVTIALAVSLESKGESYLTNGGLFLGIRNLPFPISDIGLWNDVISVSSTLTDTAYPNGIAGDTGIPTLLSPTYPYPYELVGRSAGYKEALYVYEAVIPIPAGTYTYDGNTVSIWGKSTFFEADLGIPPYAEYSAIYSPITNFNVAFTASTYTFTFKGSLTYYTQ